MLQRHDVSVQDLLGLGVASGLTVSSDVVLVGLGSLVGRSAGDELVDERGVVLLNVGLHSASATTLTRHRAENHVRSATGRSTGPAESRRRTNPLC